MGKRKKKDDKNIVTNVDLSHNPFKSLAMSKAAPQQSSQPIVSTEGKTSPEKTNSSPVDSYLGRKIILRKEKKGRSGKTVTVVEGIPKKHLVELAKTLKKAMGCGATIEADTLVLQGDKVQRTKTWLESKGARHVVAGT